MVVQYVVAKNLMVTLDLDQPRMVLGEGLKNIHGRYIGVTFKSL